MGKVYVLVIYAAECGLKEIDSFLENGLLCFQDHFGPDIVNIEGSINNGYVKINVSKDKIHSRSETDHKQGGHPCHKHSNHK